MIILIGVYMDKTNKNQSFLLIDEIYNQFEYEYEKQNNKYIFNFVNKNNILLFNYLTIQSKFFIKICSFNNKK